MASDFFRILRGLTIDELSTVMTGAGAPSGSDQNSANVGSLYLESDTAANNLNLWYKFQSTTSTVADWVQVASKAYIDNAVAAIAATGVTWKNPALAHDDTNTTLPTGTPGNPYVGPGSVSVGDGGRVLFSNLSSDPNIYVYDEPSGTFSVGLDVNPPSGPAPTGSAVYIEQGPTAGNTYIFNSAGQWVLIDQADLTELGYVQTFIGKSGFGNSMPSFFSTNWVTNAPTEDLVSAVSALDAELGANVTSTDVISSSNNVNQNVQAIADFINSNNKEGTVLASTGASLDSVLAKAVKYLVHVERVGSLSNVRAYEIFVAHNGVTTDMTQYATLAFGSVISGLSFSSALSGGNTIVVSFSSTPSVNVRWKRVAVIV
jgi:hypothetical protein